MAGSGPVFGDRRSGRVAKLPANEPKWARQIRDTKGILPPHGPFVCRLCGWIAEGVEVAIRNIRDYGFRAFPCCVDRDGCRERREMQGKDWPLVDASIASPWVIRRDTENG